MTLTSEDTVRKAKAYILFYVERTGQVATNKPAVDTAAIDGVSSEAGATDTVAVDNVLIGGAASHMVTLDEEAPVNVTLQTVGNNMAALGEPDTTSMETTADRVTSDKATEESSQAIQTVGQ